MFGHKLRYKIKVVFALVENMVIKNRSRIPIAVLLTKHVLKEHICYRYFQFETNNDNQKRIAHMITNIH